MYCAAAAEMQCQVHQGETVNFTASWRTQCRELCVAALHHLRQAEVLAAEMDAIEMEEERADVLFVDEVQSGVQLGVQSGVQIKRKRDVQKGKQATAAPTAVGVGELEGKEASRKVERPPWFCPTHRHSTIAARQLS